MKVTHASRVVPVHRARGSDPWKGYWTARQSLAKAIRSLPAQA